jgi:hypothetical protein
MAILLIFLEVMDKEPSLLRLYVIFGGVGLLGLFACRRIPWLALLLTPGVALLGWLVTVDLRDPFVRDAIMREAGRRYLILSYAAVALGALMPLLGCLLARKGSRTKTVTFPT